MQVAITHSEGSTIVSDIGQETFKPWLPIGHPSLADRTEPCQKKTPPPPNGAVLSLNDVLKERKNESCTCMAPPPKPLARFFFIELDTKERLDESKAEIAPPEPLAKQEINVV